MDFYYFISQYSKKKKIQWKHDACRDDFTECECVTPNSILTPFH